MARQAMSSNRDRYGLSRPYRRVVFRRFAWVTVPKRRSLVCALQSIVWAHTFGPSGRWGWSDGLGGGLGRRAEPRQLHHASHTR